MLLKIIDGAGVSQTVVTPAQEAPADSSGTIAATGVAQVAIPPSALRSGFIFQNKGSNVMHVNDLAAATVGAGSFAVQPGAFFPPAGYPVSAGAISVLGTINDVYTARSW